MRCSLSGTDHILAGCYKFTLLAYDYIACAYLPTSHEST